MLHIFIITLAAITFALMACDPRPPHKTAVRSAWQAAETADPSQHTEA